MLERLKQLFSRNSTTSSLSGNFNEPTNDERPESDLNEVSSLSWEIRVQSFIACFILSIICSLLGNLLLFTWKITGFTVMVSLGSILSLIGTFLLVGPLKQLRKMFERGRFLATLIYLFSIVLTLVAGLLLHNPPLALIAVITQYAAMAWYSMTYIPFAREAFTSVLCFCFN